MGYKKPLEIDEVKMQLMRAYSEIMSPYNDGFTSFYIKQDMYRVKWMLEEMIRDCPEFSGEREWLEEQDKKKVWRELKK